KSLGPWRMIGEARHISYHYLETTHTVAVRPLAENATADAWSIQVDRQPLEAVAYVFGNDNLLLLRQGANQQRLYVQHTEGETHVFLQGEVYRLERQQPPNIDIVSHSGAGALAHSQQALTAPMAGTIVKIQVHDGETVQQRQVLAILSAMKME